jgi:hypothetical protein
MITYHIHRIITQKSRVGTHIGNKTTFIQRCANIMVFFTENLNVYSLLVVRSKVIYGALGLTLVGLSSRCATLYSEDQELHLFQLYCVALRFSCLFNGF